MKILLIDPPFRRFTGFASFYFPIGLAYLAAEVEKAGHQVSIFDVDIAKKGNNLDFSNEYNKLELYRQSINDENNPVWREIKDTIASFKPDLVGITAITTKFGSVLKTAEVIKKNYPNLFIAVGGPHPTFLPDQTLKSEYIDVVIRGEGEKTFVSLIDCIQEGKDFSGIPGLSFREKGRVFHNSCEPFIEDIDQISFPARELLLHKDNYTSEDMGVIMSSRGCPFNCSYCCHMWHKRVRTRSVKNVIAEIRQVKDRYGTTQFEFKDDSFTLNRQRIVDLCNSLLAEKLNINWSCSTRVDLLDEELIKKMKKSGCNVIKLGIETGSERILKQVKKNVTFEQMERVGRLLNKHNIFWSGYFMIGLPDETEEDILKTYKFMKKINPYYAGLGVYNPFPCTDLFYQGVKMGLLFSDVELAHFFNTNPKDYFFKDPSKRVANIEKDRFVFLARYLTEEFHKHNVKPSNIIRRAWARRLVYFKDPGLMANDIKRVFKWVSRS